MPSRHVLGRRSLLKLGGALLTTPALEAQAQSAGPQAAPQTSPTAVAAGTRVFTAALVPPGAECRVAFVSDHHYWPEHQENWGNGAQITSLSDRRMPDLADVLNSEQPDLSIHAGDVISAAGSFFPTPGEYEKQLAFAARFTSMLTHPHVALVGNHETLLAHYSSHDQLAAWSALFGPPYQAHDAKGWRFLSLNSMLPNPDQRFGRGDNFGNVYGIDHEQVSWLEAQLAEAVAKGLKVIVTAHVPPSNWANALEFEQVLVKAGCVKAVLAGHWHRNYTYMMGGIPVLVRISNVETPFGYSMLHLYPDGRIVVVQRSQHFPAEEFVSASVAKGKQGSASDRYITLGGGSQLPLDRLRVAGPGARASISDGHLRISSREGRATVIVDTGPLRNARLHLTAVKTAGDRMGGIVLADQEGEGGVEATVTSLYSPDGKVYLASKQSGAREILARSWFNIADDIAYRLTLECRDGKITATWKNMLTLDTQVGNGSAVGHAGLFVERGTVFVTDLMLESLD